MAETIDELSTYLLPGRVVNPAIAPAQAVEAEAMGFRTVWISERYDQKDSSVLLGALSQTTSRIRLGTGIVHTPTRHPLLLAAFGATMQIVSEGRFIFGFGRSASKVWPGMGIKTPTTDSIRDTALILKKLWAGEEISYHGPAGDFPSMRMANRYEGDPPPLVLAAIGPKTLALAGEVFDGVFLHAFLTPDAVARSVATVRKSAEQAGRDPDSVRVIHTLVAAPGLAPERAAAVVGGRAITYFQTPNYGEILVSANRWDPKVLDAIRSHPLVQSMGSSGIASQHFTLEQLAEVARVLPDEWIRDGSAVGTPSECAKVLRQFLDAGANEIALHGSNPSEFSDLVTEFRSV